MPAGGTDGQVLTKVGLDDYNFQWKTPSGLTKTGPGRPDKPATTSGIILGTEPSGTRYISTDGAGTGVWEWTKSGDGATGTWVVTRGDTGIIVINPTNISEGKIALRRINNIVYLSLGYNGPWGTYTISPTATFTQSNAQTVGRRMLLTTLPVGYRTTTAQFGTLSDDGYTVLSEAMLNVLTTTDMNKVEIRFKDLTTANSYKGRALLRTPTLQWITSEAWPDSL